jgi:hypothetical protein
MCVKYRLSLLLGFSLVSAVAYAASDDDYLKAVKKCPVQAGPDRDQCLTEAIETRDRLKRAEQEELTNRPATGTGVYRCVSGDGRRHTRDKHDVRLGEFCGELTHQEVAKMKAEANRPPTDSEKSSMTTRAKKMNHWDRCVEVGRVLRQTNATPRQQYWADAVIAAAQVRANDHGYIREGRVRIGMNECAVFAALGKPDAANSTHTAQGRSTQLVYREKRMYIYTEKGVVQSWQD